MYCIYSKYGKLMDRFDDEETARQRLKDWPLAWTLTYKDEVIAVK